jgi:hypothetical protein
MRACPTFALLVLASVHGASAYAQGAWVGAERSLSASLDYNFSTSQNIVESPENSIRNRPIVSHIVSVGAEFVPLERLALNVTVPIVMVKYTGDDSGFGRHGRYDDGDLHATLQDFRSTLRYQVLRDAISLSPHIGVTIPMSDYETVGYANAGRGLKQAHFGLALGRTLAPSVPNLYFHLQYEFTLSEKYDETEITREIGQNRSDLAVQLGYLRNKLELNVGANFRFAHGGINFEDFREWTEDERLFHDPLLREEFILVGGGAGYSVTDKLRLTAIARAFIRGYNTRNAHLFGVGASWDIM